MSIKRNAPKIYLFCGILFLIYSISVLLDHNQNLKPVAVLTIAYTQSTTKPVEEFQWTEEYFVNTSQCQMVSLNPYANDALTIFNRISYTSCESSPSVVIVSYNSTKGVYTLHQKDSEYICCYKKILRDDAISREPADQKYKLQRCMFFMRNFDVPRHVSSLITVCTRRRPKRTQTDAFSFVHPRGKEMANISSIVRRPSVLLWGIDSMSRLNLPRTMPMMYTYLSEGYWYELKGYNKVGDNTFPNVMALLAGYNDTLSDLVCRPREDGGLDACPLVWKDYKRKGYITAYAEDWVKYSTFNNIFKGFRNPPTDVYFRNTIVALEKELKNVYVSSVPYCLGRRHSAEYIYDSALQFTLAYKDQPTFGMFWTNTFSHNNFSMPSAMDERMVEYMRRLHRSGIMKNTIILFFSDHGMRFGPLRKLKSGFLEERLPMMYLRLPIWFKQKYKKFVFNLEQNRNRLTSPYDIYATLRHILELDTPSALLPRPEACPSCHSVFEEISLMRDCRMAGIDQHWCTCDQFVEIPIDPVADKIAKQIISKMNNFIHERNHTDLCQRLLLSQVRSVFRKNDLKTYRIQFIADPQVVSLEGTAQWNPSTELITTDVKTISLLDSYNRRNHCAKDPVVKKFCVCFD